jgi:hypothetical protein
MTYNHHHYLILELLYPKGNMSPLSSYSPLLPSALRQLSYQVIQLSLSLGNAQIPYLSPEPSCLTIWHALETTNFMIFFLSFICLNLYTSSLNHTTWNLASFYQKAILTTIWSITWCFFNLAFNCFSFESSNFILMIHIELGN